MFGAPILLLQTASITAPIVAMRCTTVWTPGLALSAPVPAETQRGNNKNNKKNVRIFDDVSRNIRDVGRTLQAASRGSIEGVILEGPAFGRGRLLVLLPILQR